MGVDNNQELPIEKGTDGGLNIDEEALASLCIALSKGRELIAELDVQKATSEDKAKGYKDKNVVVAYSPIGESSEVPWER